MRRLGIPLRVRLADLAISGDKVVSTTRLVGPNVFSLAPSVCTVLKQRLPWGNGPLRDLMLDFDGMNEVIRAAELPAENQLND
jgi:hypothetical protein